MAREPLAGLWLRPYRHCIESLHSSTAGGVKKPINIGGFILVFGTELFDHMVLFLEARVMNTGAVFRAQMA